MFDFDDETGFRFLDGAWGGVRQLIRPLSSLFLWSFYFLFLLSVIYFIGVVFFDGGADRFDEPEGLSIIRSDLLALDYDDIIEDGFLLDYARLGGGVLFGRNCSGCHGADGVGLSYGKVVVASLSDAGLDFAEIEKIIRGGAISQSGSVIMPKFDNFDDDIIRQLVLYVYFLGQSDVVQKEN